MYHWLSVGEALLYRFFIITAVCLRSRARLIAGYCLWRPRGEAGSFAAEEESYSVAGVLPPADGIYLIMVTVNGEQRDLCFGSRSDGLPTRRLNAVDEWTRLLMIPRSVRADAGEWHLWEYGYRHRNDSL